MVTAENPQKYPIDLKKAAPLLQCAATLAGSFYYLWDLKRQYCPYVSPGIKDVLGYTPEDIDSFGSRIIDIIVHPDDIPPLFAYLEQREAAKEDDVLTIEYRVKHAQGHWVYVNLKTVLLYRSASNEDIIFLATVEDLTSQKKMQENLQRSEANYQTMMNAMTDMVCICLPNHVVQYMNPAMIRWAGKDRAGKPCPGYGGETGNRCPWCLNSKASHESTQWEIEYGPTGQIFSISSTPILYKDEAVSRMTIIRDITDLKKAERAIAKRDSIFKVLVTQAPVAITLTDTEVNEIFTNHRWHEITGLSVEEVEAGKWVDVIHPDDRERVFARFDEVAATKKGAVLEYRLLRRDGSIVWVWGSANVLLNDKQEISGSLGIMADVTELKMAEEAIRTTARMEATATLAGGIAHQFNNLMVSVLGNAELLLMDTPSNHAGAGLLKDIASAAQQAGRLAQQMLAFARKSRFEAKQLNLNDIVNHVLKSQDQKYLQKLACNIPENLWQIEGDTLQLNHALSCLLLNAFEATESKGEVALSASNIVADQQYAQVRMNLKPGKYVLVTVKDTGEGMTPDVLNRVFEPFFTTKFQGRGLGLASTYGIVRNHGGFIFYQSKPDIGTTCELFLPPVKSQAAESSPEPIPPRFRILVVDDEESVLSVTRRLLSRLDYDVLTALNAQEAIRVVTESTEPIHAALLDIGMPGMNGIELFPLLLKVQPSMRIIISTGFETTDERFDFSTIAPFGFLQKPFRSNEMQSEVARAVDDWKNSQSQQ